MHFELDFTTGPDEGRSACFRGLLQLLTSSVVAERESGRAVLFGQGRPLSLFPRFRQMAHFFTDTVRFSTLNSWRKYWREGCENVLKWEKR